ncbi:NUT member 2G [Saguinus oedipus]|uniref:NUT member 2G n=1 Tax=Saguinus oedipus TaxID=9490 RepID=A0ABQ9VNH3_SAGOE|nr:NUT member 2G [Saguinus oedipus]
MLSHKCTAYGVSSRGAVVQVVLTQLGPTSVYLPTKAGPEAPPACLPPHGPQRPAETKAHLPPPRPQQPAETEAPEEIPPEVVQEYVAIMEELLGPPVGATGELEGQREEGEAEQQGDGMLLDPGVLSYVDNLCSQRDFVTKVEAVIHPRFLEELLSPDPHMDFLALSQELEQEEGLTLAQVEQGGRGTQAPHLTAYPNPAGDARLLGGATPRWGGAGSDGAGWRGAREGSQDANCGEAPQDARQSHTLCL